MAGHEGRWEMNVRGDMVATNLGIYQRAATARWYATLSDLTRAEEAAFDATREAWRDRDILDLGIGGGRTSQYLSSRAKSYVGVDYSPAMVEAAKARYPALDIRWADARDLSILADNSVDFAFFADNGVDAVDDAGRARILGEVRRVLRPGGVFLFNWHNLDWDENRRAWRYIFFMPASRSPIALLRALTRIPRRLRNYLRSRGARIRTDRYVIRADPGNDFASPHYYCGLPEMRRQLEAAGLTLLKVLDAQGVETDATIERASATLYGVVAKAGD